MNAAKDTAVGSDDLALQLHPTIVVGFGTYGAKVLRRLLRSTALRGVLVWEDLAGGQSPVDRRLEGLRLLWVPESGTGSKAQFLAEGQDSVSLFRDLYDLVQVVPEATSSDRPLVRARHGAARELTMAASGDGYLGLDVLVVAHPGSRREVGTLNAVLPHAMKRLATMANLRPTSAVAHRLNFIQVLDFENYHGVGSAADDLRRAFSTYIKRWERNYALAEAGEVGFARTWLIDGHPLHRTRDVDQRIDEVSLFLEFLIFEQQRRGDLQKLYQRLSPGETTLGTFGIRMLERSEGLTRRLGAAWFGAHWLEYMSGNNEALPQPGDDTTVRQSRQSFRRSLDGIRPKEMCQDQLREDANSMAAKVLAKLEAGMLGVPFTHSDWPERVFHAANDTLKEFDRALQDRCHQELSNITQARLAPVREQLEALVDQALTERYPLPLGVVIEEIEEAWDDILSDSRDNDAEEWAGLREWRLQLSAVHQRFGDFRREHVKPQKIKGWWLPLSLVLACGITPLLSAFILDLPSPDPARAMLVRIHRCAQFGAQPAWLGLVLLLLFVSLGHLLPQRKIEGLYQHALGFWRHEERGRFVDVLRRALRPGGVLRTSVERSVSGMLVDVEATLRSELRKDLVRMLDRLKARRSEARWLEGQLGAFLRDYGLDAAACPAGLDTLPYRGNDVWSPTHQAEDLQTLMEHNPLAPEVFQERQASGSVLRGWNDEFSTTFMYPIAFLESLALSLVSSNRPSSGAGDPVTTLVGSHTKAFVQERGSFGLAFHMEQRPGVTTTEAYAIVPPGLEVQGALDQILQQKSFTREKWQAGRDPERLYLLRVQQNIAVDCLEGQR